VNPAAILDEAPDPEAALRARLILYRAYRDAGADLQAGGIDRVGLFRREPTAAASAARSGAVAPPAPPLDPLLLPAAISTLLRVVPPPPPPPETMPRTITIAQRAE